jgi:hypothetical protein
LEINGRLSRGLNPSPLSLLANTLTTRPPIDIRM